jgi:hypothetical protein
MFERFNNNGKLTTKKTHASKDSETLRIARKHQLGPPQGANEPPDCADVVFPDEVKQTWRKLPRCFK